MRTAKTLSGASAALLFLGLLGALPAQGAVRAPDTERYAANQAPSATESPGPTDPPGPTEPPDPDPDPDPVFTGVATATVGSGEGVSSATRSATRSARAERAPLTETVVKVYKARRFTGRGQATPVHEATVTLEHTEEVAWADFPATATATGTCEVPTSQEEADDCALVEATREAQRLADRLAAAAAKDHAGELARVSALEAARREAERAALTEPLTHAERARASQAATRLAVLDAEDKIEWWRLTHELTPRSIRVDVRGGGDHRTYVAGQGLLLYGSLGVRGVRKVVVEAHLNRPGDTWQPLPGGVAYSGRTRANGFYSISIEAPSMFDISYRVRSGALTSPATVFDAKTQDVDLWVEGSTDDSRPAQPVVSEPFVILADTTPKLYKRPTTRGLPVLEGRPVTLLRRSSPSRWDTVARGRVGADGTVRFPGLVEQAAGDVVYRARVEAWREHGSDVGWTWSWPLPVHVRAPEEEPVHVEVGSPVPGKQVEGRGPAAKNDNAASTYRWGAFRWNYDWTRGEGLDAAPILGSDRSGRWTEVSTGLGRVIRMNGGLQVSSGKLVRDGRGDHGTTSALLRGAAASTGRWEAPLSLTAAEKKDAAYDAVLELVAADGAAEPCAPVVTIARWTGLERTMTIGVDRGSDRWRRTVRTAGPAYSIPIVAVEMSKTHLTWFVNGRPVGSVRGRGAWPGVPMTLRMSLVGDEREHNNTSLFSDWQRSYELAPGRTVTSGPGLDRTRRPGC